MMTLKNPSQIEFQFLEEKNTNKKTSFKNLLTRKKKVFNSNT